MMFEVISQEDTHIIKYDQDHLYVLDMIQNTLDVMVNILMYLSLGRG